jgi:insertion element IS1 protein InsB
MGDRSEKTCRLLWTAIPESYRTGETAHGEPWNNTLRQRLARFVRKTLSFSKSLFMHDVCLRLFLHRYNLERVAILM